MEDISNRTLALFLIAAIVVSVGGTLMVLNAAGPAGFTGYATTETNGTVYLNVSASVSISLDDNSIDFGSCTLDAVETLYVNSNSSHLTYNNSECSGSTAGTWNTDSKDYIELVNVGNVVANITVNSSVSSTDFFTHSLDGTSYLRLLVDDNSSICASGDISPFNLTATSYQEICNSFNTGGKVYIYSDAYLYRDILTTSETMTLTFKAISASA